MKKTLFAFLGILALSAYFIYPFALRALFHIRGTVGIDSALAQRAARPNTMLFLVARNEGGIPVAVKKLINPVFPLDFQLVPSDLIMPDVVTKKIYLEAFLNSHGELGVFKTGDLKGSIKRPLFIFSKNNSITIDTDGGAPARQKNSSAVPKVTAPELAAPSRSSTIHQSSSTLTPAPESRRPQAGSAGPDAKTTPE
ncbi:MAG: hypothetical protein WCW52_02385 [Elusimicrobiales bacterium]|jgi:hypothetical protein